jgi:hypothetical protein
MYVFMKRGRGCYGINMPLVKGGEGDMESILYFSLSLPSYEIMVTILHDLI